MSKITDAIDRAKQVKPIAVRNGTKVVDVSDAAAAVQGELVDPTEDLGVRELDNKGNIVRSRTLVSQISKARLYDNRYKKQGTKGVGYDEIWVVPAIDPKGYRAVISGMEDKQIPVYVISKDKDTGEFYLKAKTTVDYQKFHSDFTHKLGEKSMERLIPLFALENQDVTPDEIDDLFK